MEAGHCRIITILCNSQCLNTEIKSFFLAFRGTLATRHKPSGEGLKTQILKRQNFLSKDSSPAPGDELSKVQLMPDKKAKDAKVSLLADLQKMHKKTSPCNNGEEIPSDRNSSEEINNNNAKNILHKNDKLSESSDDGQDKKEVNPLLAALQNAKNSKSKPRNIKPKLKSLESADGPPSVQDQLRLKLEARKKLVDETDEGAETEQ